MDNITPDKLDDTVRIRRPARVFTDEKGRTVWMGKVDDISLETESGEPITDPYNNTAKIRSSNLHFIR